MTTRQAGVYERRGKRLLDVVVSCLLLVLLSPVLVLLAIAVRVSLGSPVLFRQARPGLGGRSFTLLKLRTMTEGRAPDGSPLHDERRLTRLGRVLRALSLDELPELLNVLRGEMSLVGPRPLLPAYLPRYTARQARRHLVRPGITGWAQVNGRNATTWEQRLLHDEWYVDHVGFALDLKILCLTVATTLRRQGISAEGHVTMPEFLGTPDPEGVGVVKLPDSSESDRLVWATMAVVGLLLVGAPLIAGYALANSSMLWLSRAIAAQPARTDAERRPALDRARWMADAGRRIAGPQSRATWTAARVALAAADPHDGARILREAGLEAIADPLLLGDVIEANCRAGLLDDAIHAYERRGALRQSPILDDHAAAAYLLKARAELQAGGEAAALFDRAAAVRPADLTARRYFYRQAVARGADATTIAHLRDGLSRFPMAALEPRTAMLGELTGDTILELLSEGVWDEKRGIDTLAVLVWRQADASWVGRLAATLAARSPSQPVWRSYLGEWYQRQGNLSQALHEYERVVADAPLYARAHQRLGSLSELLAERERSPWRLEQAFKHYTKYVELSPSDLLGLRQLTDMARRLGRQPPAAVEASWNMATADRATAATLLGLAGVEQVTLGPNVIESGNFSRWNNQGARNWLWLDQATGDPSNRGLFAAGADEISSWTGPAVRISGVWLDFDRARSAGAFGARPSPLLLEPQSAYLFTCYYRTERLADRGANVYFSDDPMRLLPGGDLTLPATDGEWRRLAVVMPNRSTESVRIIPILRSLSTGDVWFDDFEIRRLSVPHLPQAVVASVRP